MKKDTKTRQVSHYKDSTGRDFLDECEDWMTPEMMRGAYLFTISKYSRRYGQKDDRIREAKKWLIILKGL